MNRSHNYCIPGRQRWILIKEVEGSEEETDRISRSCCIGNIFRVRNVQETHSDPGNQILLKKDHIHDKMFVNRDLFADVAFFFIYFNDK